MRVCLITTSQPSANPRLVKEADALTEIGARVHVVAAHWADWATEGDAQLLAERAWTCDLLDWRRASSPRLFWASRLRHFLARQAMHVPALDPLAREAAMSRIGPDLRRAAFRTPADIFIAHNLGALPVALAAAARSGARVGFDAEDFHSGQLSNASDGAALEATRRAERAWINRCDYVTAASPGIADAYARLCNRPAPAVVLNVFPLSSRPTRFRAPSPDAPLRLYWFSQLIGRDRGLEDAVRALGQLPTDVELHLRGAWQAGYEADLRCLAASAGVADDRIISHPPARTDDLVRLSAEYDIGLALEPSTSVNNDIAVSNKLFTYLLAGNAVVATRTAGHLSMASPSMASSLKGGIRTYRAGDVAGLVDAIASWRADRSTLEAARHDAWQAAEQRFNWDVEKRTFLKAACGHAN